MADKLKSAYLKLGNGAQHIDKIDKILRTEIPFSYVLETDTRAKRRGTRAKKNEPVVDRIALACGDAAHNMRAALDHAYWQIVSPFTTTEGERRSIQFPFRKDFAGLADWGMNGLAIRADRAFVDVILGLKPHGESGGNKFLYLIDKMDIPDKHRALLPIGDYKEISAQMLRKQVADFPAGIQNVAFGGYGGDVSWPMTGQVGDDFGSAVPPYTCLFERVLDVPVGIVFEIAELNYRGSVIPTLNQMVEVAAHALDAMKPFAA